MNNVEEENINENEGCDNKVHTNNKRRRNNYNNSNVLAKVL